MAKVFSIIITTDNAAFEDDRTEEIARILIRAADAIGQRSDDAFKMSLRDSNGNTVGSATLEDE